MSESNRFTILVGILLLSVLVLLIQPNNPLHFLVEDKASQGNSREMSVNRSEHQILDGENEIVGLGPLETFDGLNYLIKVKYYLNGKLGDRIKINAHALGGENDTPNPQFPIPPIFHKDSTGLRERKMPVWKPRGFHEMETTKLLVRLEFQGSDQVIEKIFDQKIVWQAIDPYAFKTGSDEEIEKLYKRAVNLIDSGYSQSLEEAKKILDRIVLKKPEFISVYPELARYFMKTQGLEKGLPEAEKMLNAGLSMDPDHANSHVLLGYVYTHQEKFGHAITEFKKAEAIGTNNLWLYANWGELLKLSGNLDGAIEKYTLAVTPERSFDTYDRARLDAYRNLIHLHTRRGDLKNASEAYEKRILDFPNDACHIISHADFKITRYGEYDNAIEMIERSMMRQCSRRGFRERVLSLAYYTKWANEKGMPDAIQLMTKGQILNSDSTSVIFQAANSEHTAKVIPALVEHGTSINVINSQGLNALAYAIQNKDIDSSRRLLEFGADPNFRYTEEGWTPLMIAANFGLDKISRLLVDSGANVELVNRSGQSAASIARQMGYERLAKDLNRAKGGSI